MATTGKMLSSFSSSLKLTFELRAIIVAGVKDLREDMFELREGEAIGISASLDMSGLVVKPES